MLATTLDIHVSLDYLHGEFREQYTFLDSFIKKAEHRTPVSLFNRPPKATKYMMVLVANIIRLFQQKIVNRFILEVNVFCLLHYALACRADMENKGSKIPLDRIERICRIENLLSTSFFQKLTIPELAKEARMGQVQFKTQILWDRSPLKTLS